MPEGTGIITSPNAADICAQIDDLYKKQDKISQLGSRAKLYAEEELSWDKSARLLIEFVQALN